MKNKILYPAFALALIAQTCGCKTAGPVAPAPETAPPVLIAPQPKAGPGAIFRSPGKINFCPVSEGKWNISAIPANFGPGDKMRVLTGTPFAEMYLCGNIILRVDEASTVAGLELSSSTARLELLSGKLSAWNEGRGKLSVMAEDVSVTAGKGIFSIRITPSGGLEIKVYKGAVSVTRNGFTTTVAEGKKLFLEGKDKTYISPVPRYEPVPPAPRPDEDLRREIEDYFKAVK